jgi:hypothetical protein
MAAAPLRVFYSYSHKDSRMLERLRTHMAMLRREGLITEWFDREIEAGGQWRGEIERELEAADVILLLVSADFLASDFCYEQEMARAVERARRGETLLIGVMLHGVDGWEGSPFAEFQVVPRDARPISKWSNQNEAYSDAVRRIREALETHAGGARRPASRTALPPPSGSSGPTPAVVSPDSTEDFLSPSEEAYLASIEPPLRRKIEREVLVARKRQMIESIQANLRQMRSDMEDAIERQRRENDAMADSEQDP